MMFAGRYLWWILIALAIFVFFAVYFDFVSWAIVEVSGCHAGPRSCDGLVAFLSGRVRPIGFTAVSVILLSCTLARIYHLRLSLLWAVPAAIWCLATASFPALFKILWLGTLPAEAVLYALPLPLLFLATLVIYLMAPFETTGRPVFGPWRRLRLVSACAAGYGGLLTLGQAGALPDVLTADLGLPTAAAALRALQLKIVYLLQLGTGGDGPAYLALAIFGLSLLASRVPEERVLAGLEAYERLKLEGWPRRHRDTAEAGSPEAPTKRPSLLQM